MTACRRRVNSFIETKTTVDSDASEYMSDGSDKLDDFIVPPIYNVAIKKKDASSRVKQTVAKIKTIW